VAPIIDSRGAAGEPEGISEALRSDAWRGRLVDRLLAGDDAGAWVVILAALEQGAAAPDVYVDLIAGALESVGEAWQLGAVDVAAEHVATATAGRLLARLSAELPAVPTGGRVLVATPPGEFHAMPVFVVAEVLRLSGFEVVNLGADVPLDAMAAAIRRTPGLVGVCLSGTVVPPAVMAQAVAAAKEAVPAEVDVFAGGRAVPDEASAVAMGASGWAPDAREVPRLLAAEATAEPTAPTLLPRAPAESPAPTTDEMVRRLQRITDAALSHLDLGELLDDITAQTVEALDADTMAIFLREGDELVAQATRCPEGLLREDVRTPVGEGVAGRIAEHPGPTLVDDLAESDPTSRLHHDKQVRSLVGVPLVVDGRVIGVTHVGSRRPRHFTEADARFLKLVGDRVALAIDRARLFEAEREARTLAEANQRRLAFLTTAGEALARSLDRQTLLATLVDRAVPFLADWAAVDFEGDDGDVHCLAAAHRDPTLTPLVRQLHDSRPPRPQEAKGVGWVVRTGEPVFRPVIREQDWALVARTPERLAMFRALGPGSAMILPVILRGRLLGTVSFVHSTSGRRYSDGDLALAEELVRRMAMALDNAELFSVSSEVARVLQASLLPPHLPDIPGIELDGLYQPGGGEGLDVGGDFYDVFLTEPGDWALVVGDVCGKGAEAAAVTAMGRYTLRAAAMQARRPSRVLHVLNEAMLRQDPGRPFLTVAYARLQLPTGEAADDAAGAAGSSTVRVTVGCGGHPLPFVVRADGRVEALGRAGTLLGCFPELDVEDVACDLAPGDALVLYTDGVDEARGWDGVPLGQDRLAEVLSTCAGLAPSEVNRRVADAVEQRRGGRPGDDVAVLTLRVR
jgi:serine phosphatase RsbU (regulator of sigma subunit)/methanogenic corrinoid protein MtbC1/putative methionine-R-sulfoxide reductase with GAF domain